MADDSPDAADPAEEEAPPKLLREYDSNVFILSSAGKPIYCQHGDESELTSFVGLIQVRANFVLCLWHKKVCSSVGYSFIL